MKTQEQIRAEFDRLMEEDRTEEAEVLSEQIIPVSREEFRRRLEAAPYDDEPVTPEQRQRLDELHTALEDMHNFGVDQEFSKVLGTRLSASDRASVERAWAVIRAAR